MLLYGLELILPGHKGLDRLETYQKLLLKRLLSLPTNTPDPAVYILSGFIPVEGQIDHKALTLFNNICRQNNSSTEKQLAYRQLLLKDGNSHSWFVQIRKILCRYELPNPFELLDQPPTKICWKNTIEQCINKYGKTELLTVVNLTVLWSFWMWKSTLLDTCIGF